MAPHPTLSEAATDTRCWRSVLTGLRILLLACVAAPAAVALGIMLFAALALLDDDPRWVGRLVLYLIGGGFLLALVCAAVGVGYCCRVPPESGARGPLVLAIALVVAGGTLALAWQFLDSLLFSLSRAHWPTIRLAVHGVIVGSLAAGCLSWLLFLRALALALGNEPLSRGLRLYAIGFAVWAGIAVASLWLLEVQERENPFLIAIASVNMMLGFGHCMWMLGLLASVAEAIEAALLREEGGKPNPGPTDDDFP